MTRRFVPILLIAAVCGALTAQTVEPAALVVVNAVEQTKYTRAYDPAYVKLAYPGGDVPRDRGICADVVVRAFRAASVDLQVAVHEDMKAHFSKYPQLWSLHKPDSNIDHRRVANLMTFFQRQGKAVANSSVSRDYLAGDVVAWQLPNGHLHIGVVTNQITALSRRPLVVHNIGEGARLEDVLFAWRIIGHYRYFSRAS